MTLAPTLTLTLTLTIALAFARPLSSSPLVPVPQFVHNNQRVFGYNSPASLQLRDQDRILVAASFASLPLLELQNNGAEPMEE